MARKERADLDAYIAHERVWPISLILASALFAVMYGFFALGYSDDPKSCEASSKDDIVGQIPYVDSEAADGEGGPPTTKGNVNIAYRFSLFFTIGFYLSLAQVAIGVIALVLDRASTGLKTFLVGCYKLTWFLIFWNWVWCLLIRFQESGRTCSGDYMANRNYSRQFLYVQGLFMYFAGLIVAFIYVAYGINWIIGCCRAGDKKKPGEVELYEVA